MSIRDLALEKNLKDVRIFDAHFHIGESRCTGIYIEPMSEAESLALSKRCGIDKVAGIAMGAMGKNDTKKEVDWLVDLAESRDDMFFYAWYQPRQHQPLMEQIAALKDHPLFMGVKIHPREDCAHLDDGGYDQFMEYCAVNDVAVLCHTWDTEPMNRPRSFERYLAKYPEMKIILGHMGGTRAGCLDAMRMAREYKNVYCDINGSLYSELWLEELVKQAPEHKFIFSTDQTFNDPRPVLGRVLFSKIPDRLKEKILCENIEQLVGKKLV